MENLKNLIQQTWDGDVTFKEATKGYTDQELNDMNKFIPLCGKILKDGVPYPQTNTAWGVLVRTNGIAKRIQEMVNRFEDDYSHIKKWEL